LTKSSMEIMEILDSYDRVGCAWSAAKLAGVDARTVARSVEVRDAGGDPFAPAGRVRLIDPFMASVEQMVDLSECQVAPMSSTSGWSRWGSPAMSAAPAGRSPN
jgi:hypothetical protein